MVSDHFEMGYALNTINQKAKTGKPFTTPELQTADTEDVQGPSRIQIEEQDGQIVQGLPYRIGTDGHQTAHASA